MAIDVRGYVSSMARGERPRKIKHHWIQDVVAENVRTALEKSGRSPADVGTKAGVGRKSVERLRAGKNSTLTTLGAVADELGKDPLEFLVRQRTPLVRGTTTEHKSGYSVNSDTRNNPPKSPKSGKT